MAQIIFFIIITIIVFDFVLERILEWLNDSKKSKVLPKEAAGIYDEEKYAKWIAYDKAKSQLGYISSILGFVAILFMLFSGGFGWLDSWLRNNITDHFIFLPLIFFGVFAVATDIIGLPIDLYNTFVVEERFGFNRTTWKTYVLDKLKGAVLGVVLGGGLLSLVIWLHSATGSMFWWLSWGVISIFMLFMAMFAASWIIPLFNKLTPMEEGELRYAIEAYCKKVGFKLNDLFVMDGSKRSSKANAFFSGLGPKKKIVLYDTLIEKLNKNEIVAVLAHEIGHYKRKHTRTSLILSLVQTGLTFFLLGLLIDLPLLNEVLGSDQWGFHLSILTFFLLYSPLSTVLGIGMNVLSRKHEFEADAYAATTYEGEALKSALKKLHVDSLGNLTPHPAYVFFHYSHPPLINRMNQIDANKPA